MAETMVRPLRRRGADLQCGRSSRDDSTGPPFYMLTMTELSQILLILVFTSNEFKPEIKFIILVQNTNFCHNLYIFTFYLHSLMV